MPSIDDGGDGKQEEEWMTVHRNGPSSSRRSRRSCQYHHAKPSHATTPEKAKRYNNNIIAKSKKTTARLYRSGGDEDDVTSEQIEAALKQSRREVRGSDFWKAAVTTSMESCLGECGTINIHCIVCYGIGTFGTKRQSAPLWQLALALELRDLLVRPRGSSLHDGGNNASISSAKYTCDDLSDDNSSDDLSDNNSSHLPSQSPVVPLLYFEPLMTPLEAKILEKLKIQIIQDNERGCRRIGTSVTERSHTLFFMPHCPMRLYSNLLHTNWDDLRQHVIIFGNSLSRYIDGDQHHQIIQAKEKEQSLRVLRMLRPFWKEKRLIIGKDDLNRCAEGFEQAFNDTSLTYFPSTKKWPERPQDYCQAGSSGHSDGELL
jgi:SRR1